MFVISSNISDFDEYMTILKLINNNLSSNEVIGWANIEKAHVIDKLKEI